jgi:hypothetical protein
MLHKLGVNMGDTLYPPDHGNPRGHFEDIDFMEANTAILRAAGGEWHNPPSDFQIRVFGAREGQRVIDLINKRNDKRSIWGFKDPRTCLTLPLYLPHLADPLFVVVDRCCKEVANSLHRRDGIAFHHQHDNEALCEEYKSRLESGLRLVERSAILRLQFSNVLNAPQEVASFLARAIGTSPTEPQFTAAIVRMENQYVRR